MVWSHSCEGGLLEERPGHEATPFWELAQSGQCSFTANDVHDDTDSKVADTSLDVKSREECGIGLGESQKPKRSPSLVREMTCAEDEPEIQSLDGKSDR